MSNTFPRALLLALAVLPGTLASAADEQHFGATVASVAITKPIPAGALGLENTSSSKVAGDRKLAVTGADPHFTLTGQAFCKSGARLTAVQAVAGKVLLNGTELFTAQVFGSSPKLENVAGKTAADLSIPVSVKVTRTAGDAAVDLSFNPAREFEKKIAAFVAKGGSAAAYLRETQAFDVNVTLNLVAWCRMSPDAESVLAGKTYPGFVARVVPVTVLYDGDPAITDGPAAREGVTTSGYQGSPPARTEPPKPPRAKSAPQ